jgi:plasmid stabilization system protein ParE
MRCNCALWLVYLSFGAIGLAIAPRPYAIIMPCYPYIITYRIRSGSVEVLRFFHGARQCSEALYNER